MIVKVRTAFKGPESGWALFDNVEHIEYGDLDHDIPMEPGSGSFDYTKIEPLTGKGLPEKIEMWLTLTNGTAKKIWAYRPVYLLNDVGKTIDSL